MGESREQIRGDYLNDLWGVGAKHALYIYDGHWYHQLKKFPGALFDQGLLGIDTQTMTVLLAPSLRRTTYAPLLSMTVRLPKRAADAPSKEALDWHRREHGL